KEILEAMESFRCFLAITFLCLVSAGIRSEEQREKEVPVQSECNINEKNGKELSIETILEVIEGHIRKSFQILWDTYELCKCLKLYTEDSTTEEPTNDVLDYYKTAWLTLEAGYLQAHAIGGNKSGTGVLTNTQQTVHPKVIEFKATMLFFEKHVFYLLGDLRNIANKQKNEIEVNEIDSLRAESHKMCQMYDESNIFKYLDEENIEEECKGWIEVLERIDEKMNGLSTAECVSILMKIFYAYKYLYCRVEFNCSERGLEESYKHSTNSNVHPTEYETLTPNPEPLEEHTSGTRQ
ncbi:hypothetical protein VCUG_02174, partial [Vavraia culicis subsp. floridensis]